MYKKGETVLSDITSSILTAVLLAVFVVIFLSFGDKEESSIVVNEVLYTYENVFVLESYLNTPSGYVVISDVIDDWLVSGDKDLLVSETKLIFDEIYGKCYSVNFMGKFFIGDSSFTGHKATCIDYPNFDKDDLRICIDFSTYDENLAKGEEEQCF
ncbi:hypothetical protein HN865_02500 [Candidatus Woesearchaeota archaeon]|jgi:hypothetical protein|nr:hypothetical protein [Cryomorphaceae bacterium]MBT7237705.1 hypothetical protein [Candidatus Woesearchaeota archaeon]